MRNFKRLNRPFGTPFSTDYLSEDAHAAEFRGERPEDSCGIAG